MGRTGLLTRWIGRCAITTARPAQRRQTLRALKAFSALPPQARQTYGLGFSPPWWQRILLALWMVLLDRPAKMVWLLIAAVVWLATQSQRGW